MSSIAVFVRKINMLEGESIHTYVYIQNVQNPLMQTIVGT